MKPIRFCAPLNGDRPGPWRMIEDSHEAMEQAKREGAAFLSTMAFEYEPQEGKDEPRRHGDLVFDFDHKEDPEIARNDCILLVQYLRRNGVDPHLLGLFVSGRKGFHIIVPTYLFGAIEGDPLLPMIYLRMAQYISVRLWCGGTTSLDFSMYAMGKGKLLRLENVRRGIGTYKVPVTWEELSGMSYSELAELTVAPRQIEQRPPSLKIVEPLASMFAYHRKMVHCPPSSELVDTTKFIMQCKFVQHCTRNAASLSEPEWYAMLSVLKGLGQEGRWLAHDLSCEYPGYSRAQTDKKFDRAVPNMSCEKIKQLFDCDCECGVQTPSMLWAAANAGESANAAKSSEAEKLIKLADTFDLYPSENGLAYADVMVDGHRETFRVESRDFREILRFLHYKQTGKALKALAANDLIGYMEAKALHGGAKAKAVYTRVAHCGDVVFIDLCDEKWRAIEITAEGWKVVDEPPVRFRRVMGMQPLVAPAAGGSVHELGKLLNVDEGAAISLEAWLLGALSPGPYPVLVLEGEQGTAKSTTTEILRQLIDPSIAPTRSAPRSEQDLVIAAHNSHVIALDNLSGLSPWISDALCRIATGGSFSMRKLYTNEDEVLFTVMKPIILNGIDQLAERHDLADRCLRVTLPVIPPSQRLTETQLKAAFDEAAPKILAGLCDGVSCALRNRTRVEVENPPRMADFTKWCVAGEDAMSWEPGAFLQAYRANQSESVEKALTADHVANAIITLMRNRSAWEGTPSELLQVLEEVVGERVARLHVWPKTATSFGKNLTRVQAFLRKFGIDVNRQSGGNRTITMTNEQAESAVNVHVGMSVGEVFE